MTKEKIIKYCENNMYNLNHLSIPELELLKMEDWEEFDCEGPLHFSYVLRTTIYIKNLENTIITKDKHIDAQRETIKKLFDLIDRVKGELE
jgi:hypothetical protein